MGFQLEGCVLQEMLVGRPWIMLASEGIPFYWMSSLEMLHTFVWTHHEPE